MGGIMLHRLLHRHHVLAPILFLIKHQHRVAQQRRVRQQPGMATAHPVLSHQRVFSPMRVVFHRCPVSSYHARLCFKARFLKAKAAEVIARFFAFMPFLCHLALALHGYEGARSGKAAGLRANFTGAVAAFFHAPVSFFGLRKKGGRPSSRLRACACSPAWFSLICNT